MNNLEILESKIKEYSQSYYSGSSVISDESFDALIDELRKLDPNNLILTSVGWGFDVSKSNLEKVAHTYGKVGSLGKVKSSEGVTKYLGDNPLVGTPKLDGLTVVTYYNNGILSRGVTRGNGTVGQDVTVKIKDKVPSIIEGFTGAIRGEFILPLGSWKEYYSDAPSPRNTASGVANRKSVSEEELDRFKYVVYQVVGSNKEFFYKQSMLNWLGNVGFEVTPSKVYLTNQCTPEHMKSEIDDISEVLDLPLDGMVLTRDKVTMDDGEVVSEQIAYKVQNETAITRVESIDWNLTRTGKYAPVANLEAVELSGATIKKASVFNAEYVEKNRIGSGALVSIVRSGEIIPVVLEVLEPSSESLPTHTKDGYQLVRKGKDLILDESNSDHYTKAQLVHWVERVGAVDGIGGKVLKRVLDGLDIEKIQDLYTKDHDMSNLKGLEGFGLSTLDKVNAMFNKLNSPMTSQRFLSALGLSSLGSKSSSKLIDSVGIDFILDGKVVSGLKVKGVSKVAVSSIEDNIDLIREVHSLIKIKEDEPAEEEEDSFKVSITGRLNEGRKRSVLEDLLKSKGISTGSVGNDTKYLITNNPDPSSSKGKKAVKLGVEIITESDFLERYNLNYG